MGWGSSADDEEKKGWGGVIIVYTYTMSTSIYYLFYSLLRLPVWRFICLAADTNSNRFILTIDHQVIFDVLEPKLEKIGREFAENISELIGGPNFDFTGKFTQLNIYAGSEEPDSHSCEGKKCF